jgi:MFS family permease
MGTAPGALVGDAAGERGGKPVSVFQAASDLGGVIGPLLAGALADAASPTAAFASAFVLLAASALLGLRIPRSRIA